MPCGPFHFWNISIYIPNDNTPSGRDTGLRGGLRGRRSLDIPPVLPREAGIKVDGWSANWSHLFYYRRRSR